METFRDGKHCLNGTFTAGIVEMTRVHKNIMVARNNDTMLVGKCVEPAEGPKGFLHGTAVTEIPGMYNNIGFW